jgi:hypothetical protein
MAIAKAPKQTPRNDGKAMALISRAPHGSARVPKGQQINFGIYILKSLTPVNQIHTRNLLLPVLRAE